MNLLSYSVLHKEWVIEISQMQRGLEEMFAFVPFLCEVALKATLPVLWELGMCSLLMREPCPGKQSLGAPSLDPVFRPCPKHTYNLKE